ncbi:MAG TPA: type IIL restriction-modification enzyme MmeI [Thermomicrobiales bacterium]|nr:type IIL restriction-modification enzyme MmeI [Thermomicrobiales bacterium]
MHPVEFVEKWRGVTRTERSAAQEHFLDLCRVLDVPTPAEVDKHGATYTFEKGATKSTGGSGWADVWYRGHFAWEYKGPDKDLGKAYDQLLRYKDHLENPPLLVVSDLNRIVIRTNFTNTTQETIEITLDTFAERESQDALRRMWTKPMSFRPGPGGRHRGGRETLRRARRLARIARARPPRRRPLPRPAPLLPLRRGHRPAAEPNLQPPARLRQAEPRRPARRDPAAAGNHGQRRPRRLRDHPSLQRRSLP